MDTEEKQLYVFTKALEGSEQTMVIDSIRKFRLNVVVTDISKNSLTDFFKTKVGKIIHFM